MTASAARPTTIARLVVRALVVPTVALAVTGLAGCSLLHEDDSSAPDQDPGVVQSATAAQPATTPPASPASPASPAGGPAALVGTWTADIATILQATAQAPDGVDCGGPYTLTFADGGAFSGSFDASCTAPLRGRGGGTGTFTGSWAADATTVTVSGVTGAGSVSITVLGQTVDQDLPTGGLPDKATTAYTVAGDTLTYVFGSAAVTFTRAA